MEDENEDVTEKRRKYFSEKSSYTPETRIEMQKVGEGDSRSVESTWNCLCQVMEEIKEEKENNGDVPQKEKKQRQLFMK